MSFTQVVAAAVLAWITHTPLRTPLRAPRVVASAASATTLASAAPASDTLARGLRRVTLPVATRTLQRGDTLRADDIALLDTTIVWRWNGIAPDTTRPLPGWTTRRAIAAGEVLRAPAVGAPIIITGGATVSAIWQDGPVRVVLTGIATNSASLGAPISVRIDRMRRLDGVAIAPNTVRLR